MRPRKPANPVGKTCRVCGADDWRAAGRSRQCVPCGRRVVTRRAREVPIRVMLSNARNRARRGGVDFALNPDELVALWPADRRCPVLGIDLVVGGGRSDNSPSLDRLDPTRGYVKGNVAFISDRANRIKNNGTASEHEQIAAWMREKGLD